MSEAPATSTAKPATKDKGLRGRKVVIGLSSCGTIEAISTVGWLVLDKMSAEQWIGIQPMVLISIGVTAGLISLEKVLAFRKGGA